MAAAEPGDSWESLLHRDEQGSKLSEAASGFPQKLHWEQQPYL